MCNDSPKVYSGQLLLKKVICTKVFTHSHFHSESKYYIFQIFIQLREEKVFAFRTRKGQKLAMDFEFKKRSAQAREKVENLFEFEGCKVMFALSKLSVKLV